MGEWVYDIPEELPENEKLLLEQARYLNADDVYGMLEQAQRDGASERCIDKLRHIGRHKYNRH